MQNCIEMSYSSLRGFTVLGAMAIAILSGCADTDDDDTSTDELNAPIPRTVCFAGRTAPYSDPMSGGGIPEIDRLCKVMPNLVRDVPTGRDAKYNFFQWNSVLAHELDVLVGVLDTNKDGKVTGADAPVSLTVVGYSWGGFNAVDFINGIANDKRFSADRKSVAKFFALDAYRTDWLVLPRGEMPVPANVQQFYAFRHSVAPADDCSRIVDGWVGPFTGRVPACTGKTECHDFDFSVSPKGKDVDHCSIPDDAKPFVLALNANQIPSGLPPEQWVTRY